MLRISLLLMLLVSPLTAHVASLGGAGGWANVPVATTFTPVANGGVIVRLYYADGSGLGALMAPESVSVLPSLFDTEQWHGTDLRNSLAAKQGLVNGESQCITTKWVDKKGGSHEVCTPCPATSKAGRKRCLDNHKKMVDLMQTEFPPLTS